MTTTSTLTLSAFLLARYDEWEALARKPTLYVNSEPDALGLHTSGCAYWMHEADDSCKCHGPAFVLAQVASLRAVVELHDQNAGSVVAWRASLLMLQALAQPWADRPDFPRGFGDAY